MFHKVEIIFLFTSQFTFQQALLDHWIITNDSYILGYSVHTDELTN